MKKEICEICGKKRADARKNPYTGVVSCQYCEEYLDTCRTKDGIPVITDVDRLREELDKRDN